MTTNSLEIKLTTLTPIWTGGIGGEADRLHPTGIIGSMRWWYEVIVRGLGGWACDPSEHNCLYEVKASNQGLCDVCRVFGATGWARRFRLIVTDETQLRPDNPPVLKITAARSYKDRSGQTKIPTWYLKSAPRRGHVDVKLISTDQYFQIEIIGGLIQFLADWASFGAKPQMGFGIADVIPHQDTQYLIDHLQTITGARTYNNVPTLRNIFFTSIKASRSSAEETFNLKYDLRDLLRRSFPNNRHLRHFVMGTVQDERQSAKIAMSRPYGNNTIRVWGWIPEEVTKFGASREQVMKQIHTLLSTNYIINYWREFNSTRDTEQQYADPKEFLKSLLEIEENADA